MANNFQPHTGNVCIPCTKPQFDRLKLLLRGESLAEPAASDERDSDGLDEDDFEDNEHGFQVEFDERDNDVHLFAELGGNQENLPAEFLKELGRLMVAAGLEFLEIGFADTCDKMRPGSHGGGFYRIMPNGEIVYPVLTWPTAPSIAAAVAESALAENP